VSPSALGSCTENFKEPIRGFHDLLRERVAQGTCIALLPIPASAAILVEFVGLLLLPTALRARAQAQAQ
jgi:hypothetical protein